MIEFRYIYMICATVLTAKDRYRHLRIGLGMSSCKGGSEPEYEVWELDLKIMYLKAQDIQPPT